ncbi:MAG TPA: hypothetical protein VLZ10_05635 [Thermodesulfobacteriota bacterium]|nr:hypothetical protein [Thermodesulfobacteriota bacterium]
MALVELALYSRLGCHGIALYVLAALVFVSKEGGKKMRIFLESEEYWFEDFKVDSLPQAISELKALYRNCKECFKEDGIVRKIGIIIE